MNTVDSGQSFLKGHGFDSSIQVRFVSVVSFVRSQTLFIYIVGYLAQFLLLQNSVW